MTMDDFLAQLDAQLYILTPEERERHFTDMIRIALGTL